MTHATAWPTPHRLQAGTNHGSTELPSSNSLSHSNTISPATSPSALTREMAHAGMQQPPNQGHGPSEKEKKYDRQLRLWAASGQDALESAHILLVNSGCGTVGIETLKNLVLPGMYCTLEILKS